jgi:hypothetical protein
MNEITLDRMFD